MSSVTIPVKVDEEEVERFDAIREAIEEQEGSAEHPTKNHFVEDKLKQWNEENEHYLEGS